MYYVRLNADNVIVDILSYQYEGFEELNIDKLPSDITGGWFKLENGVLVEHQELRPLTKDDQISKIETALLNTKLAMAELVEQQQADKLNNQLALAELIESIMEGGTTA